MHEGLQLPIYADFICWWNHLNGNALSPYTSAILSTANINIHWLHKFLYQPKTKSLKTVYLWLSLSFQTTDIYIPIAICVDYGITYLWGGAAKL
jgi:hypothetical protein